jgi:hypothetical protein
LRELARKHKIGTTKIYEHSKNEEWVKAREDYRAKVAAKALQKACKRRAKELEDILETVYLICERINAAMGDPDQLFRYLVKRGAKGGECETVERVFCKLDTNAVKNIILALQACESIIRSIEMIPTEQERQKLDMEKKRFELEKARWQRENEPPSAQEVHIVFCDPEDLKGWQE